MKKRIAKSDASAKLTLPQVVSAMTQAGVKVKFSLEPKGQAYEGQDHVQRLLCHCFDIGSIWLLNSYGSPHHTYGMTLQVQRLDHYGLHFSSPGSTKVTDVYTWPSVADCICDSTMLCVKWTIPFSPGHVLQFTRCHNT